MSPRHVITLAAVVVAMLALEDITTDNATTFVAEWSALAVCAIWFAAEALRVWRSRRTAGASGR
jgi:hypothetical protein